MSERVQILGFCAADARLPSLAMYVYLHQKYLSSYFLFIKKKIALYLRIIRKVGRIFHVVIGPSNHPPPPSLAFFLYCVVGFSMIYCKVESYCLPENPKSQAINPLIVQFFSKDPNFA